MNKELLILDFEKYKKMKIDKMAIYLIGNPKGQKEYVDYLKSREKELDDKIKILKEQILKQNK